MGQQKAQKEILSGPALHTGQSVSRRFKRVSSGRKEIEREGGGEGGRKEKNGGNELETRVEL